MTIPANAQGETVPLQITVTVTAVVAMVAPPTPVTVTVSLPAVVPGLVAAGGAVFMPNRIRLPLR